MKKVLYIAMAFAALALVSCNKFLDRPSKTQLTDDTYWSSELAVRLFVNGAYTNYFNGYHNSWSHDYAPGVRGDGDPGEWSDDISTSGTQMQPLTAASSYSTVYNSETISFLTRTQSCGWNMAWVRKWNLLIDRLKTMHDEKKLNDEEYNHWDGVAHFLRAYEYSRLVMTFGDVVYYDTVVDQDDLASQYLPRTSRVTVMENCMKDFQYAFKNVRADDGPNYINKGVVGTYASRFMLFEGSWEYYHKTEGGKPQQFWQAAEELAKGVIDLGKYHFDCSFKDLFNSLSQVGTETIMYRSYSAAASTRHCILTYSMPQYGQGGYANFNHLESWVCLDGHVVYASTTPDAESWRIQDMQKSRDPRFEATFYDEPNSANGPGLFCWKWIDRKGPGYYYANARTGAAIPTEYGSAYNITGAPVIRYAETVLNWIEAKAELAERFNVGSISAEDLKVSINAIRQRPLDDYAKAFFGSEVKTADLTAAIAAENAASDPQYSDDALYAKTLAGRNGIAKPSPILWEIRRERRMEFFNEHVRSMDIRRWGELERLNNEDNPKTTYGVWIDPTELGEDLTAYREGADYAQNKNNPKFWSIYNKQYTLTASTKLTTVGLDGQTKHVYAPVKDDVKVDGKEVGSIKSSNLSEMAGFKVPENFVARDKVTDKDYLYPLPSGLINQYKQRSEVDSSVKPLTQNPGW